MKQFQYLLYSLLSGLLLAFSWPTKGIPILLFIGFVPLLIIQHYYQDKKVKNSALKFFGWAYLSFFIWNAYSYGWLSYAHPQENPSSQQITQAWIAYGFPVLVNSLLMSLVLLAYHKIKSKSGNLYGIVFLPSFWMVFEKIHLNWDFSWPWLNLGNGFASYYKWVQWYEFTGAFGGTLWIWIANFIFFYASMALLYGHGKKTALQYLSAGLMVILVPIGISYLMYFQYTEKENPIQVAVLQPKLNPYTEKYTQSSTEITDQMIALSEEVCNENTDFVLAPETAFPGRGKVVINQLKSDTSIRTLSEWVAQHSNTILVSGVELIKFQESAKSPNITAIPYDQNVWYNAYNSVLQIEADNDSIAYYHKSKLVVQVELFPYPRILKPLLGEFMLDFGGSTYSLTGQSKRTVFTNQKNKAKVAPLVCYESIFGEFTSEFVKNGANVLFISTNDSWWGETDGHLQFLDYARLRAIENRRSIARSANSGVSAFINQKGDIEAALPYNVQGALLHEIQLNDDKTFYTKHGDYIAQIALLLSGILWAYFLASILMVSKLK